MQAVLGGFEETKRWLGSAMRESPQGADDQRELVRLAQPGAEVKDGSRTRRRKLLRVKEGRNVGWSLLQSKKEKLIEVVRGQTWSLSSFRLCHYGI
jgi:hypothetical protein